MKIVFQIVFRYVYPYTYMHVYICMYMCICTCMCNNISKYFSHFKNFKTTSGFVVGKEYDQVISGVRMHFNCFVHKVIISLEILHFSTFIYQQSAHF